jgi:hypothetical protein
MIAKSLLVLLRVGEAATSGWDGEALAGRLIWSTGEGAARSGAAAGGNSTLPLGPSSFPAAPRLLIGCFSSPEDLSRRSLLRSIWAGPLGGGAETVFMVRSPASSEGSLLVEAESESFGDMIIQRNPGDVSPLSAFLSWCRARGSPLCVASDDATLFVPHALAAAWQSSPFSADIPCLRFGSSGWIIPSHALDSAPGPQAGGFGGRDLECPRAHPTLFRDARDGAFDPASEGEAAPPLAVYGLRDDVHMMRTAAAAGRAARAIAEEGWRDVAWLAPPAPAGKLSSLRHRPSQWLTDPILLQRLTGGGRPRGKGRTGTSSAVRARPWRRWRWPWTRRPCTTPRPCVTRYDTPAGPSAAACRRLVPRGSLQRLWWCLIAPGVGCAGDGLAVPQDRAGRGHH